MNRLLQGHPDGRHRGDDGAHTARVSVRAEVLHKGCVGWGGKGLIALYIISIFDRRISMKMKRIAFLVAALAVATPFLAWSGGDFGSLNVASE